MRWPTHASKHGSLALMAIADAEGDVDAFIGQYDPETLKVPKIATEIASRLLTSGRAEDAWGFIERADFGSRNRVPSEWQSVRPDVLTALGRRDEAQAFRLKCFQRTLASDHLRAYLKHLPDSDDVEAEDAAMKYSRIFYWQHRRNSSGVAEMQYSHRQAKPV